MRLISKKEKLTLDSLEDSPSYTFQDGLQLSNNIVSLGGDSLINDISIQLGEEKSFSFLDEYRRTSLTIFPEYHENNDGDSDQGINLFVSEVHGNHTDVKLTSTLAYIGSSSEGGIDGPKNGIEFIPGGAITLRDDFAKIGTVNADYYEDNFVELSHATCRWVKSTAGGIRETDIEFTDVNSSIILRDNSDPETKFRLLINEGALLMVQV